MNAFGYIVRRVLWQFGLKRAKKRWEVANRELQILKEAEDLLGKVAWREAGEVEELTGEFWQLRNIENQEEKLTAELEAVRRENEALEDKIFDVTDDLHDEVDALVAKREKVAEEVDRYLQEIEDIRELAAEIRRRFEGYKVKYRVLKEQGDDSAQLEEIQSILQELRDEFNQRKEQTLERNQQVERIEARLLEIDEEIQGKRAEISRRTAKVSIAIGENSKRLADLMAQLGAFERERKDLQSKIGLYLSANPDTTPATRKATERHMDLISKINYFRKSIQYNQRLAKGA